MFIKDLSFTFDEKMELTQENVNILNKYHKEILSSRPKLILSGLHQKFAVLLTEISAVKIQKVFRARKARSLLRKNMIVQEISQHLSLYCAHNIIDEVILSFIVRLVSEEYVSESRLSKEYLKADKDMCDSMEEILHETCRSICKEVVYESIQDSTDDYLQKKHHQEISLLSTSPPRCISSVLTQHWHNTSLILIQ